MGQSIQYCVMVGEVLQVVLESVQWHSWGGVCNTLCKSHIVVNMRDARFISKSWLYKTQRILRPQAWQVHGNSRVKCGWVVAVPGWVTHWEVIAKSPEIKS